MRCALTLPSQPARSSSRSDADVVGKRTRTPVNYKELDAPAAAQAPVSAKRCVLCSMGLSAPRADAGATPARRLGPRKSQRS